MNWAKILEVLKIPLKILLPSLCLFSGILIFGNDELLSKMNLLIWSEKNGFIFGLVFLISFCLILVYSIGYVLKKLKTWHSRITLNKRCFKTILSLDYDAVEIIGNLYKKYDYTDIVDYNQPIIKGLISRNLIFTGGQQVVSTFAAIEYGMDLPIYVILQPVVWKALDKYLPKLQNQILKRKKKIVNIASKEKREKMEIAITNAENFVNAFVDDKN